MQAHLERVFLTSKQLKSLFSVKSCIKMKFCKNCGIMLVIKNGILTCPKCGHEEGVSKITVTEKIDRPEVGEGAVENTNAGMPITDQKCPKCGHMKAYSWARQMRAGDEGETAFFKCVKCAYSWREK